MRVRFTYLVFLALATAAQATIPAGFQVMNTGLSYSESTGLRAYARVGENCSEEKPVWSQRELAPGVSEWTHTRGKVSCTTYGVYSYLAAPEFEVDLGEKLVVHVSQSGTRTPVGKINDSFGQTARVDLRPGSRILVLPEGVRFYFRDLPVSLAPVTGSTYERLHGAQ